VVKKSFSSLRVWQVNGKIKSLLEKSASHSPQALAWGSALLKAENRFNGLHGNIEDSCAASETVKTVAEIQCPAVTPG
jgi:hypothetical protein